MAKQHTDQRYWSHPQVVAASRAYICARLLAFEDPGEIELLTSVAIDPITRQLENTVFGLFAPDGQRQLVTGSRYPSDLERDPGRLARRLRAEAAKFAPKATPRALPAVRDVRLAVNVAACDDLPLVIVSARDRQRRAALRDALAQLAWSEPHIGQLTYVVTSDPATLDRVGAKDAEGVLVVAPHRFGERGRVIGRVAVDATPAQLRQALTAAREAYEPIGDRDCQEHVDTGRARGANWIPKVQAR